MVEVSGVGKEKRGENQGGAAPGAPCDMGTEAKVRDNLANWNDRAALHAASAFYGVDALVENPEVVSGVARRDLEVLAPHLPGGSVEGLSLLHLQCHIGTDTLSWRRMGADPVWGLDFSPASLAQARSIAARAGADVTFVEGDARRAADVVDRTFDVVVTSIGTICWLPGLGDWARSIARLLVPGGVFMIRDDHPILNLLGYESTDRVLGDYLSDGASDDYEDEASYVGDPGARVAHTRCHNWRHDFAEITSALIGAGLSIEALGEHPTSEWRCLPGVVELGKGLYGLPPDARRFPLTFSLVAHKPR